MNNDKLLEMSRELIDWLCEHGHPHMEIVVTHLGVTIKEESQFVPSGYLENEELNFGKSTSKTIGHYQYDGSVEAKNEFVTREDFNLFANAHVEEVNRLHDRIKQLESNVNLLSNK